MLGSNAPLGLYIFAPSFVNIDQIPLIDLGTVKMGSNPHLLPGQAGGREVEQYLDRCIARSAQGIAELSTRPQIAAIIDNVDRQRV